MFKQLSCSLLAVALVLLYPAGAGRSAAPVPLGEIHEEFTSATARDSTDQVVWDTAAGELRLGPTASANQHSPQVLPGPDGGLLALWVDERGTGGVFAQRFNSAGQRIWPTDRFLVNSGEFKAVVLPGGGFALAFTATPVNNPDIFAMVFDSEGQPGWDLPVRVNTDSGAQWQVNPDIGVGPDNSLYVAWTDYRTTGPRSQIFAQRLSATGTHLWGTDRKLNPDSTTYGDWHFSPQLAVDSAGNLVAVWQVHFGNTVPESEDYEFSMVWAQRVASNGSLLWGLGVEIMPKTYLETWFSPDVVALPGGGSMAVFWGYNDTTEGMFARRLADDGSPAWPANRLLASDGFSPDLREPRQKIHAFLDTADSLGVIWRAGDPLYYQRFDLEASPLIAEPVLLALGGFYWRGFSGAGLSDGSAALAWDVPLEEDTQYDVFLQRASPEGQLLWGSDGINVLATDQFYPPLGKTASKTVDTTSEEIGGAVLTVGVTLNGGKVAFDLSNDGGQTWQAAQPGQDVTFNRSGSDLRWRVTLTASPNFSQTPQVDWLHIVYGQKDLPPTDEPPQEALPFSTYLPLMGK